MGILDRDAHLQGTRWRSPGIGGPRRVGEDTGLSGGNLLVEGNRSSRGQAQDAYLGAELLRMRDLLSAL